MNGLGDIKAKGLDKQPYASETPARLYPIKLNEKPEITVSFLERARLWLSEAWNSATGAISKVTNVIAQLPKAISDMKTVGFILAGLVVVGLIIYLVV